MWSVSRRRRGGGAHLLENDISSLSEEYATLKAEGMFLEKMGTSPEMQYGRVLDLLLVSGSMFSSLLVMAVRGRVLDWARTLLAGVSLLSPILCHQYWSCYHHRKYLQKIYSQLNSELYHNSRRI